MTFPQLLFVFLRYQSLMRCKLLGRPASNVSIIAEQMQALNTFFKWWPLGHVAVLVGYLSAIPLVVSGVFPLTSVLFGFMVYIPSADFQTSRLVCVHGYQDSVLVSVHWYQD